MRIESIEAEAEALVRGLGESAYGAARRREHEVSSDEIARDWGLVALAVARLIGERKDLDPLLWPSMNAVLDPDRETAAPREPLSLRRLTPVEELGRVIAATMSPFQIQFVGSAQGGAPIVLTEVEIHATDAPAAIVAAANLAWPLGR